ncbi:MAG TPA: aromatic amino acid ammonia-lyase [Bryobacteraceae bacterium]|nr:aromatic amino acid ammonia-lyase [Bryobacteraceae bacterium]
MRTEAIEETEAGTPAAADESAVAVRGRGLTISDIARVAAGGAVRIPDDEEILRRVRRSCEFVRNAVESNTAIYGVTTCFGGMADRAIPRETAAELQTSLLWSHTAGTGDRLPAADVRAGMLLRANSMVQGISAVRMELIRRMGTFLNANVTPHVREFGSIGASGDQVPLAYVAGSITGLNAHYLVDFDGHEMDAPSALRRLGLAPVALCAKEGLALINGTSMTSGIAANCVHRAQRMLALSLLTHALFIQALDATNQAFHPFIHAHKPHPGQIWAAGRMQELLRGSKLIHDEMDGHHQERSGHLIQERYSIRCLPQFMGPIADGLAHIARQVETEANSVTDNPLIDAENEAVYHGGNFLAQYIGISMDQLRNYIGLMAKHLDVQIALAVAPEFNHGLSASLVGNQKRETNTGLKSLQLTANSLMPMIQFYGNSIADRFPTHAEQFNQNLNSQGFGSANLARRSLDLFEQYAAVALMFAVQAVDLRTSCTLGHYDARAALSSATARLYEAVRRAVGRPPSADRPLVWDDREQFLDERVAAILRGIQPGGVIADAIAGEMESVEAHRVA